MADTVALPDEWEQTLERSTFDSHMVREYTTVNFAHSPTGQRVIINNVQKPHGFGGWGYLVHVTGPEFGELDLVEDLSTARAVAREFMEAYPN